MNHDDMARLLPAERDLPAARKQILKEHLMTELRQADTSRKPPAQAKKLRRKRHGPRRGGRPHGAAAVAIATAAAVGMHSQPARPRNSPARTRRHRRPATRQDRRVVAARQPTPVVRDSDFMYIRSDVAYEVDSISNGRETSTIAKPHERQIWLPVTDICTTGLLIENGERTPISPFPIVNGTVDRHPPAGNEPRPNFTCPSEGHLGDATYRLMQSIPTQHDALLAYLKAGKKWTNDDPPTEIGDLIREAIVPPALAAALYRLAATLPGATLVPHATNLAAGRGIGIMWTSTSAKQVYKNEWIFDQTTLQFIGERIFNPKTGQVTGESAILQQAFTVKAGQRP